MDQEAVIAAKLQASIPKDTVSEVQRVEPVQNTNNGQATTALPYELDEMVQYKLHDLFSAQYDAKDETTRQQLSYIYEQITNMLPEDSKDYGFVASKIYELQRMIGISEGDNRIYRMYQWLKLNNVRRNLDAEMESITNG